MFQPVERDFAFIVDRDLPAETLAARRPRASTASWSPKSACSTSTKARVCPKARNRSRSRSPCSRRKRTLTDAEIEGFSKRLVAAVEKATGGQLRG